MRGQAHALHNLAYLQLHEGDATGARALFRESLVIGRDLGTVRDQLFAVVGLACASVPDIEPRRVTRLLGAAATVLVTLEGRLEPAEDAEFQRAVDAMRARLDPGEYAMAWTEGHAMTLAQAVEYALASEPKNR
jgi:hypothetical protein